MKWMKKNKFTVTAIFVFILLAFLGYKIVDTFFPKQGKNEAKKLVDNILEPFTESQIGYYDFQVFIKKEDTSENDFPIIGYKHHNSSTFSWTKDREKTEEAGTK